MLKPIARSIRYKIVMVVLATTAAALLVAGAAMMIYDLRSYQASWVNDLNTQAGILGRASAPALAFNDPKSAREYLALLAVRPDIAAAAIYNANGKIFASYHRGKDVSDGVPQLPEGEGPRVSGNSIVFFKRIVENNEILGTVYVRADYRLRDRLTDYLGILGAVMVLSLLVAFLISTWLQATVTKPILAISAVAHQVMEKRDFSLRVRRTTEDEIGYLVDAINDMLAEVGRRQEALEASNVTLGREMAERARAEDQLRELNIELERRVEARTAQLEAANKELESFSYSVSHDLRAPVRAIIGFSRMLSEEHTQHFNAEAQRLLGIVQSEAHRMGALIDDLLAFSRLGRQAMQISDIDMAQLARVTYESLIAQHPTDNVEFRLGALPRARGDRSLLGQVWANLLANALKFSSKEKAPCIEVSAITDENEFVYFVRDNGVGFDPRYQSKLYGVFQRLHDASDFPGTG
ncbi:MAG TPA: CHASE sensor domain-containing protein, partial [Burkholderiales bacterium]|nr:CHASE sensor domain-containing protein [Burkholderiales bacterium]